jgi:hypothetical protein
MMCVPLNFLIFYDFRVSSKENMSLVLSGNYFSILSSGIFIPHIYSFIPPMYKLKFLNKRKDDG